MMFDLTTIQLRNLQARINHKLNLRLPWEEHIRLHKSVAEGRGVDPIKLLDEVCKS